MHKRKRTRVTIQRGGWEHGECALRACRIRLNAADAFFALPLRKAVYKGKKTRTAES